MAKYTVWVKQVYVYEGVEAKNQEEAIEKVVRREWDYSEDNIETSAELEENEDEE